MSGQEYCFQQNGLGNVRLLHLADPSWRDAEWTIGQLTGTDLETGGSYVGVAAFSVTDQDRPADSFELCVPTTEYLVSKENFPCVPIPGDQGTR